MLHAEIDMLCAEVAHTTGLPITWVRHHVDTRAGRPCPRCGGSGIVGRGSCFRCKGSGGKATREAVTAVLDWVRANREYVRVLGERRTTKARIAEVEQRHQLVVEAEAWKKDHAEMWSALDDLFPSDFKDSLIRAVEQCRVTPDQEDALQKLAEAAKRRSREAPAAMTRVDVRGRVTSARHWVDPRGRPVFRIDFASQDGWSGRIETTDDQVISRIQCRRADDVAFRSVVSWSRGGYAIFAGSVEIL